MNDKSKIIIIVLAILAGLVLNGMFIVRALERFRREDRSISVKGFSEREVKADFAVWTIKTRITTNDIIAGSKDIEANKTKIIEFLLENGIKKDEIRQQNLSVNDKLARDYGNSDIGAYRYIIENSIQVRTSNVDTIQRVSKMTDKLLKAGVVISNSEEYNPSVQFLFTKLNDIKPEMLSEATKNARKAAMEFTKESKVKLGALKKANQGLFTIMDRDASNAAQSGEGGYYASNVNDVYKKVRVVVNIEYFVN
jgi:hypothetical protein